MKTDIIINQNGLILSDLEVGDWFTYYMPDESEVIAIKGDDTIYEGSKIICMRILPLCGVFARLNNNLSVEIIKNVRININHC